MVVGLITARRNELLFLFHHYAKNMYCHENLRVREERSVLVQLLSAYQTICRIQYEAKKYTDLKNSDMNQIIHSQTLSNYTTFVII